MRHEKSGRTERAVEVSAACADWMHSVVSECQRVVNHLQTRRPAKPVLSHLRSLPKPSTRFEELLLHGLLLEVCAKAGGRPAADIVEYAIHTIEEQAVPARRRAIHDAVRRAARLIEARYAERLDMARLAADLNCREVTLRAQFARTFGMCPREYHRTARVRAAQALFARGTHDVLSVARLVGYRSEKNFYAAVRQVTGLSVAGFRQAVSAARRDSWDVQRKPATD